jgi:predicted metal-dependent phosphoesterase TrpH
MKKERWIDLHLHSNLSDGISSPSELAQKAKEHDLSAISIVDHDTIEGLNEANKACSRLKIELIPGVELSSQCNGRDIHILGYFVDCKDEQLLEYLKRFRQERYRRAVKMINNLSQLGVHLQIDEIKTKIDGKSIGRPHLAEVLMEKGYVETFQEAFDQYIGYGSQAYEEKYKILPEDAIELIVRAKGLSFLAHPGYIISNEIIIRLIKAGLHGIEVVHPNLNEQRSRYLQKIAKEHKLLISGGSDCHGNRNGSTLMGKFNLPYTILEDIKNVHQKIYDNSK